MSTPDERPQPSVSEVLLPLSGAARHARNLITGICVQWGLPHLLEPACLVVTELVANAAKHAQTMIDLRVIRSRRHVVIEVHDGSPAAPRIPTPRVVTAHRFDPALSRGLLIVAATADRWGYRRSDDGKVVWAALHDSSRLTRQSAFHARGGRTGSRKSTTRRDRASSRGHTYPCTPRSTDGPSCGRR